MPTHFIFRSFCWFPCTVISPIYIIHIIYPRSQNSLKVDRIQQLETVEIKSICIAK